MNDPIVRVVPQAGDRAEHRASPAGTADAATFPSGRVTRSVLQPGRRWSEHVGKAQGLAGRDRGRSDA